MKLIHYCRLLFFVINNFYAVPVYLTCYLILQPLKLLSPGYFWSFEGWLYEKLLAMAGFWAQLAGHNIYMSGDDVSSLVNDKSVVISNHQSTSDVPLLMYTLHGIKPSLRHVMWIMDWILQFTNFGWVAKCHGDCFILQGSDIRKYSFMLSGSEEEIKNKQAISFKEHLINIYNGRGRKWMVLFPEGGFLYKRRSGSQRYCQKNNMPLLNHVALPRTGALKAIMNTVKVEKLKSPLRDGAINGVKSEAVNGLCEIPKAERLKWIIDITVGYPDAKPLTLLSWVTGNEGPKNIFVNFKVHHASEAFIQNGRGDTDEMSDQWLYDQFIAKEKLLGKFYTSGIFPAGKLGIKKIDCFTFDTIIGHLFCIIPYIAIAWILL